MEPKESNSTKNIRAILILIIVAGLAYIYHVRFQTKPCEAPIKYSLGEFDEGFGVSQTDFLDSVRVAGNLWSQEEGKPLFEYADKGGVVVNLIYGDKQKETQRDQILKSDIDQNTAVADSVKAQYSSLKKQYENAVSDYEQAVAAYNARQSQYNAAVSSANRRGGAKEKEYQALEAERASLMQEASLLRSRQFDVNSLADDVNALIKKYNLIAENINAKADVINQNAGEKFSAGEYIVDENGKRINIYQFENKAKMIRVLAHELGHALGVEHVADVESIMYEMNSGESDSLGEGDSAALSELCHPVSP